MNTPCEHVRAALDEQIERARAGTLRLGRLGLLAPAAVQRGLDKLAAMQYGSVPGATRLRQCRKITAS